MAKGIRVLYVDDEPGLLEIARLFLEQTGEFYVTTSTSAEEALASSSILSHDIIVSDYQMPGKDGISFLKEVRQRYGDIPFILFTGRGREEVVIEAINNGADFYLQKGGAPIAQFAELSHKIRQVVRRRVAESDLEKSRNYLNQIFSSVKAGIMIIDAENHTILDINPEGTKLMGLPREQIVGRPCHTFICPAETGKCPITDLHQDFDNAERLLITGTGTRIPIIKYVAWTNLDGRECLLETFIDNRDRKQAESALKKVSTELQLIFRNMINAFIVWESVFDENGRYVSFRFGQFNDAYARMAKVKSEDVRGKDVFEVWPATEQSWVEVYGTVATTGIPRAFDMYHEPTKGWYHCNAYRPTTTPDQVCVIIEDITERRRDETELRAAYEQVTAAEEELRSQYDEVLATEQRIRESEEKYRLVVENSQDAIYIHRADRLVFFNSRALVLTGYPHDELMNIRLWDLLHPDDRNGLIENAKKRFAGIVVPPGFTARLLTRDGTVRVCEFIVDLVMYQGAPAILGIARDITGRRLVEEALQKSEEKYRELVEDANSIILKMDKNGNVTFFNEFAQRFFGYTNDEIIGKPVVGTIVPVTESGSGRDLRVLLDDIVRQPGTHMFNENENTTRDGKRVWIRWHNKPLLDRNGQPSGVLSIGTDITGRRQAEEALQKSEEKYRRIIEKMQDAYIRSDENGVITMVSPSAARIFGYGSPEKMVGLPILSLYNIPAQREEAVRVLQDGGEITDFSSEGIRKDGTTFWFSLNIQFIRDEEGRIQGYEGTMRDISERRSMEHAIKEANKKLNMLSGITRHDIKNQLSALDGFVGLLRLKTPAPSLESYFLRITAASDQIKNLIQFMSEYEKVGLHAPEWQGIPALVDDAARTIALGQVTLKNELPAGMEVFADPLVARVIDNLVDNAVRHGGKIRVVRFSLENRNGDRIIVCADDGDGVAAHEKEKIFDLGFGKNTGFGLAISREILAITGITIRETGKPGTGARFELVVPQEGVQSPGSGKK